MVRHTQCSCGEIKVTIKREPFWVLNCHCKTCRKFLREETMDTNAHFNGYSMFWFPDVKVEGPVKWKKSVHVCRGACPKCRQVIATKGLNIFRMLAFLHPSISGHAPTDNIYYPRGTDPGHKSTNHLTSYGWPNWCTIDSCKAYGDPGSLCGILYHLVGDVLKCGCCCCFGRPAHPRTAVAGELQMEVAEAAGLMPSVPLERQPDKKGNAKVMPFKPQHVTDEFIDSTHYTAGLNASAAVAAKPEAAAGAPAAAAMER